MTDDQQRDLIAIEDVQNLRRMHAQQFRRLVEAQARGDGPGAGRALNDLVMAHRSCTDLYDVVEYLLSERAAREERR